MMMMVVNDMMMFNIAAAISRLRLLFSSSFRSSAFLPLIWPLYWVTLRLGGAHNPYLPTHLVSSFHAWLGVPCHGVARPFGIGMEGPLYAIDGRGCSREPYYDSRPSRLDLYSIGPRQLSTPREGDPIPRRWSWRSPVERSHYAAPLLA